MLQRWLTSSTAVGLAKITVGSETVKKGAVKAVSRIPQMESVVSILINCRVHQNLAVAARSMASKLTKMELASDWIRLIRPAAEILATIVGSDVKADLAVLLRHRRAHKSYPLQHWHRSQLVKMGHAASPTSLSVKDRILVVAVLLLAIAEMISIIVPIS